MKSIQYTIRNIPPTLDSVLRLQAVKTRRSLNEVVVETLQKATGWDAKTKTYTDFDWLYGSGGIEPKEDSAFKNQRLVDLEAWR